MGRREGEEESCLGLQFPSPALTSSFLLSLCWSVRGQPLFSRPLAPGPAPILSCPASWAPASSPCLLTFLTSSTYTWKTQEKLVTGLRPAEFFLKAGVLYMYDSPSCPLPALALPLPGSHLSCPLSNQLQVVQGEQKLLLLLEQEGQVARLVGLLGRAQGPLLPLSTPPSPCTMSLTPSHLLCRARGRLLWVRPLPSLLLVFSCSSSCCLQLAWQEEPWGCVLQLPSLLQLEALLEKLQGLAPCLPLHQTRARGRGQSQLT